MFLTLTTLHSILNTDFNLQLRELFVRSSSSGQPLRQSNRLSNLVTLRCSAYVKTCCRHRAITLFNSLTPQLKSFKLKLPFNDGVKVWHTTNRLKNYVFF